LKLIIASKQDPAGVNIVKKILEHHTFKKTDEHFDGEPIYESTIGGHIVKVALTNSPLLYSDNVFEFFKPELTICASKHSSESGLKVLTVHVSGNIGEAKFGGRSSEVAIAPPIDMKIALNYLLQEKIEQKLEEYNVSYEATHHGPSVNYPLMFIEVGSTIREWEDKKAVTAAAKAILSTLKTSGKGVKAIGIGGGHYCPKFTKLGLESEFAPGHIVSKYATEALDKLLFEQLIMKTVGKAETVIFDWKGVKGKDRRRIIGYCDELGIPYIRV